MIPALLKFGLPLVLFSLGLLETFVYFRVRKYFNNLPVVAAEVTQSKLHDNPWSDSGRREYEALIKYKYTFRGTKYEGNTPALRSYRLWPDYGYEWKLLKKYKVGEIVNARVLPGKPEIAYLEVAPLHKLSAILMPVISVGYFLFLAGYFYFVGEALF